tara:strand:+ start:3527 stop:4555 length:1029 start_codon:yes stop_codon:yes gene_type:complete
MKESNKNIKTFELIKNDDWPEYDMKITLKPTFKCNHECWFCGEYDNLSKSWDLEQCNNVLKKLEEIPDDRQHLFFYFYGGEPTLSKYWEYLNYEIIKMFPEKKLFLQTHSNLSLNKNRLKKFLSTVNNIKKSNHTVNICNSYHIGKQSVKTYVEKMDICNAYDCLGYCFFSTEIPKKEQMLNELNYILKKFPTKLVMKFTEIENLLFKNIDGYNEFKTDDYLIGNDNGKSLEYRYWMKYHPELRKYFEDSWTFLINGSEKINYSDVKGKNIHKSFKFTKCDSGKKNVIIDHNLKVYRCNDYNYKNINPQDLQDLNFKTFLSKCEICLLDSCCDGLDFKKTRV